MIGIIGAMRVELDGLRAAMTDTRSVAVSGVEYIQGKIGGRDVVAAMSGVGKVFAAVCAQTMILRFNVECIINIGVVGTLTKELNVLDIALADSVIQHDMDTSAVGDPVGLISGINIIRIPADEALTARLRACVERLGHRCVVGTIASGDQFVASKEKKDDIRAKFDGVIAAEMEGGSIGQVCYINHVPFAVLRTISDGDGGGMDYQQFVVKAAETSIAAVIDFIRSYN